MFMKLALAVVVLAFGAGVAIAQTTGSSTPSVGPVDVSGPCDEAEHANDPRCTGGVQANADDDRRGRGGDDNDDDHSGRGHGGGDNDDNDDRSGSNSGRG